MVSSSSSSQINNNITTKSYHSLLASKLTHLTIPSSAAAAAAAAAAGDFDFSDVFGPPTPNATSTSTSTSASAFSADPHKPHVIFNRSHSFVGPSPRLAASASSPFARHFDLDEEEDEEEPEESEEAVVCLDRSRNGGVLGGF